MKTQIVAISAVKVNAKNPRLIKDIKFKKLVQSIKDLPDMLKLRPIVVDEDMVILGGNMRYKACVDAGLTEVPIIIADEMTKEEQDSFVIKDNVSFGEWDWDILGNEYSTVDLGEWGLDVWQNEDDELQAEYESTEEKHNKLQDTFVIPPFSVLDTRQGYWKERKAIWHSLIQDKGESRENTLSEAALMSDINNGVSILDPVLAEIANKWFGLNNCNTFDCFAGDSVFGYVSDSLGNSFTGIELRKEQADLNNKRLESSRSKYICDDGQNVLQHIQPNTQDLLFSCPPYFDLEVYSDLENDASNQKEYSGFLNILRKAFTDSIQCLKDNRFAFIVVGDIRAKNGAYYNFPNDVKSIFLDAGMHLYNEMILVEPLGTLPQRVGRYMNNRKIGKCHQNILVFYKGDTKAIKNTYHKIEINESADI